MKSRGTIIVIFLVLIIASENLGFCNEEDQSSTWIYSLYFENDTFFQTDHLYTNGLRLSAASSLADSWENLDILPAWMLPHVNGLPFVNNPGTYKNITLSVGQMIYTPMDTDTPDLSESDRPYAGLAYTAIGFCERDLKKFSSIEFIIGIVGPHSYAEDTQKSVHQWLGQDAPNGWDHQVDDEFIFNLGLERRRRWRPHYTPSGFGMEWIPSMGMSLGNAITHVHSGLQLRMGWNLPQDFGEDIIRLGISSAPSEYGSRFHHRRPFSIYAFGGMDGQFILWDVTLDGNTFDKNEWIQREPFRYTLNGGIGGAYKRFSLSLSYVRSSEALETQTEPHEFGTILLSIVY